MIRAIDELHDELLEERPGKHGALQRLTSLVVKILDPNATVAHDRDVPAAPRAGASIRSTYVDERRRRQRGGGRGLSV